MISEAVFSLSIVSILDGDTLEVLHNDRAERIRLNGIDCPEKGQPYGKRAKQAASELVFGKQVTLETFGKDKYGRTIADVLLPDGTKVNYELVKDGWSWWYRKYAPSDTKLEMLEAVAKAARRGLWADPKPVPPWEWRKGSKYPSIRVGIGCDLLWLLHFILRVFKPRKELGTLEPFGHRATPQESKY